MNHSKLLESINDIDWALGCVEQSLSKARYEILEDKYYYELDNSKEDAILIMQDSYEHLKLLLTSLEDLDYLKFVLDIVVDMIE